MDYDKVEGRAMTSDEARNKTEGYFRQYNEGLITQEELVTCLVTLIITEWPF